MISQLWNVAVENKYKVQCNSADHISLTYKFI